MIKPGARDYLGNGHGLKIEEGAEAARTLEQEGMCLIEISRPLIREPDLIKRWRNGDTAKAACISCEGCFGKQESGTHRIGCRQI